MGRGKKGFFFHSSIFPLKNRLALTTGDPQGIGKKITVQALKKLGPVKNFQFLLWTSPKEAPLKIPGFQSLVFKDHREALKEPFQENQILQIRSPGGVGDQLIEAGGLCLRGEASALITGPVRKELLKKHRAPGQTEILKRLCQNPPVFMGFRGSFFNCVLFSDHIPLKKISLDKNKLKECFIQSLQARAFLPPHQKRKPIGVLGLNPHAGEKNLMGEEEEKIIRPLIKSFSPKEVEGPLSPDSAFLKKNWKKYSFFIGLYHDQALIPFKMIHNHKGFAQTLGLPFLRLGVDHGTGYGLKEKEISSESLFSAIKESIRLIRLKK